jgi:hypothetical protein
MQTDCIPDMFGFEAAEGRAIVAVFDGGAITSDTGVRKARGAMAGLRR